MQLSKDLREYIDLLNANKVEYLVAGGSAVAWHGHPCFTAYVDQTNLFLQPKLDAEEPTQPDQIVLLGVKPCADSQ